MQVTDTDRQTDAQCSLSAVQYVCRHGCVRAGAALVSHSARLQPGERLGDVHECSRAIVSICNICLAWLCGGFVRPPPHNPWGRGRRPLPHGAAPSVAHATKPARFPLCSSCRSRVVGARSSRRHAACDAGVGGGPDAGAHGDNEHGAHAGATGRKVCPSLEVGKQRVGCEGKVK